jgi:DNA-directed RNA polymerase subunit RPC12/RpoP
MELSYLQNCPSCGAPVEVAEADRVIACRYCDGRNYMVADNPLRFVLPSLVPDEVAPEDIVHIPYLRFKGYVYSCVGQDLEHKIVDTTQLGYRGSGMPASLGLRPQAMQIRLVGADHPGRFARLTEKVKDVFAKAAKLTGAFSEKQGTLYHRSFIGETISCIYLPAYFKEGRLMDGVLNREISINGDADLLLKHCGGVQREWLPGFISTICPHCAAALSGASDSLILECHNCGSLWQEKNGRFEKVAVTVVTPVKGDRFLPFWRITVDTEGLQLKSFADFLRITNHPVVIRDMHENREHSFWVPAFKVRPKHFLHISKALTVSQQSIPEKTGNIGRGIYPTTLPLEEAVQALKAILTAAVMNKRDFTAQLPRITMKARQTALVYLPFTSLGHDLVQDHTSVTIAEKSLHYGRMM